MGGMQIEHQQLMTDMREVMTELNLWMDRLCDQVQKGGLHTFILSVVNDAIFYSGHCFATSFLSANCLMKDHIDKELLCSRSHIFHIVIPKYARE